MFPGHLVFTVTYNFYFWIPALTAVPAFIVLSWSGAGMEALINDHRTVRPWFRRPLVNHRSTEPND